MRVHPDEGTSKWGCILMRVHPNEGLPQEGYINMRVYANESICKWEYTSNRNRPATRKFGAVSEMFWRITSKGTFDVDSETKCIVPWVIADKWKMPEAPSQAFHVIIKFWFDYSTRSQQHLEHKYGVLREFKDLIIMFLCCQGLLLRPKARNLL